MASLCMTLEAYDANVRNSTVSKALGQSQNNI